MRLKARITGSAIKPAMRVNRLRLNSRRKTSAISLAVNGIIERDISAERLRERMSELLRRYVPAVALPTPIGGNGDGAEGGHELERQP